MRSVQEKAVSDCVRIQQGLDRARKHLRNFQVPNLVTLTADHIRPPESSASFKNFYEADGSIMQRAGGGADDGVRFGATLQ
jgi:hypothetical protein